MAKPSVYFDTSFFSALHYSGRVLECIHRQVKTQADALHLAYCVAYEIDYLMSWNYAHLANPEVQVALIKEKSKKGRKTPRLVTPDSIPQKRFGQHVMP